MPHPAHDPGSALRSVRDDALCQCQKDQHLGARNVALRAFRWIEGGVLGSPARCGVVKVKSRTARHARFVSGGPGRARIDLPRPQACETCGGTAPRPASATPRERAPHRTRMYNDIAELAAIVKNKVRTYSQPTTSWPGSFQAIHVLRTTAVQRSGSPELVRG